MKVFGKEINIAKIIVTVGVVMAICSLSMIVAEFFSAVKTGLGVNQLNGTDADYTVSVLISRIEGISSFVLSLLAIFFIWRGDIAKILNPPNLKTEGEENEQ